MRRLKIWLILISPHTAPTDRQFFIALKEETDWSSASDTKYQLRK